MKQTITDLIIGIIIGLIILAILAHIPYVQQMWKDAVETVRGTFS